jgi:hypothetical protein
MNAACPCGEAARRASCSPGYLSNAAHGRNVLTPSVAARRDRVLGTEGTLAVWALSQERESHLPAAATGPSRPTGAPGRDRQGDGQPASSQDDPEQGRRLGYALAHPASTDLVAVAHLREQVRRLDEQYDRSPAATLIAEAGQCLGQVMFPREHACRVDVRRDLCGAEAP